MLLYKIYTEKEAIMYLHSAYISSKCSNKKINLSIMPMTMSVKMTADLIGNINDN